MMRKAARWMSIAMILAATQSVRSAPPLTADGLVLVVNKNQPEGLKLARHYAQVRGVPDDRIIEVAVPDGDEIAAEFYEKSLAEVVRQEIQKRQLREKTQCIVLFYGIPLRIRATTPTPAQTAEAANVLDPMINMLRGQLKSSVFRAETLAVRLDPTFKPAASPEETEPLQRRGAAAEQAINRVLPKLSESARAQATSELNAARSMLTKMPTLEGMSTTRPAAAPTQAQVNEWMSKPDDAEARRQLREAVYQNGNAFQLLVLVENQKRLLLAAESEASVDSELSCVFRESYPRTKWVMNPWNPRSADPRLREQTIRTARIDGPTPEIARRIIDNAISVEKVGLKGDFVIDAQGMHGGDNTATFDGYDQSVRNVAKYLDGQTKTIFDNTKALLPDRSSDKAAVYVGWYSVRKYRPTATYVPGSVAWHVASYELMNLRSPAEQGWCRNLMLNGADVTIGPVAEPYLISFPPADEFFGLLFTGRASVCEAYWASLPITSWKMILIGDPLYRPFAKRPIVSADRLPDALQKALPDAN